MTTVEIKVKIGGTEQTVKTFKELEMTIKQLKKEMKEMKFGSKEFNEHQKQIESLKKSYKDLSKGAEELTEKVVPLKTQLRQMKAELLTLDEGSDEFKKLALEASELEDRIGDVSARVKAFASDTKNLDTAVGAIQGLAGAFQAAQGAAALFGSESEEVQAALGKVIAIQGILNGINQVAVVLNKEHIVGARIRLAIDSVREKMAKAQAASQLKLNAGLVQQGAASKVANNGMVTLNRTMLLNPAFLVAAAIGAIIGVMYAFSDSTDEADESMQNLNNSLDKHLEGIDRYEKRMTNFNNNELKRFDIRANEERAILQESIDMLEAKGDLTQAEEEKIHALRLQMFDLNKKLIEEERVLQLAASDSAQKAEQKRYDATTENLKTQYALMVQLEDLGRKSSEEYTEIKARYDELKTEQQELSIILEQFPEDRVNTEQEYAAKARQIERDKNVFIAKEEADRTKNSRDNAQERRKILLQEITDIIARQKAAGDEIEAVRIGQIENLEQKELELLELQYGQQREKLIDAATKRELQKLDEKFINSKMSEEDFLAERKRITENGINNLLPIEQKLLDMYIRQRDVSIQTTKERFALEAEITKTNTEEIISNRLLAEIRFNKEMELLQAESIQDDAKREDKIQEIKAKYRQQEIDAINKNLEKQGDARWAKYQQDINQEGLTADQKLEIQEQYLSDVEKMEQEAQTEIANINAQATENLETELQKRAKKINEFMEKYKVAESLNKAFDLIDQAADQAADNRMFAIQKRYDVESEALKESLANKLITEEEYANEIEKLNQIKREKERAEKIKAFKRDKANKIVEAVMNTALGVGAALTMPPPASFILAGITAGLGAAQVAIIANQRFTAARGGVVPAGGSSTVDSIPALLASGEFVINAASSAMFPELLSAINQMGGGIPLVPNQAAPAQSLSSASAPAASQSAPTKIRAYIDRGQLTDSDKREERTRRATEFR